MGTISELRCWGLGSLGLQYNVFLSKRGCSFRIKVLGPWIVSAAACTNTRPLCICWLYCHMQGSRKKGKTVGAAQQPERATAGRINAMQGQGEGADERGAGV